MGRILSILLKDRPERKWLRSYSFRNKIILNERNSLASKSKTLSFFLFFSFSFFLKSQINLIQNPSFENFSSCPSNGGDISKAYFWDTLQAGGGGSPDLFSVCAPWVVAVPNNAFTFQNPLIGSTYAGFCGYQNSGNVFREYIQTILSDTLISGKNYCLKFFLNLSNTSKYCLDQIGGYFDNGSINTTYNNFVVATPQVASPVNQFLNDTLNWLKVEGNFIASGTEFYLTIGNFKSDIQTNVVTFNSAAIQPFAYYLIDNVSLLPVDLSAIAGPDVYISIGDSAFIGQTPEIGLNDDCFWYVAGNATPFDTVAGLWVKPGILGTHTYVVEQDICGTITYDTVNVFVTPVSVSQMESFRGSVKIYPNPASENQEVSVAFPFREGRVEMFISDVSGNIILRRNLEAKGGIAKFVFFDIANGVYFLHYINLSTGEKGIKKLFIQN